MCAFDGLYHKIIIYGWIFSSLLNCILALRSMCKYNTLSKILFLLVLVNWLTLMWSEAVMQEIWTAVLQAICFKFWEIGKMNVSILRAKIEVARKVPNIIFWVLCWSDFRTLMYPCLCFFSPWAYITLSIHTTSIESLLPGRFFG